MSTRLTIIDNETRTELAEMGMETRVHRVLCQNCRFVRKEYSWSEPRCIVNGNQYAITKNPTGECDKYEGWPAPTPVRWAVPTATGIGGAVLGFLLGLAVFL